MRQLTKFRIFFSVINLSFLNSIILFSDKDKYDTIVLIAPEIKLEYKIWGIWYMKLNFPLSTYILCMVESLKNRQFIVKYNENINKNRHIFIILYLPIPNFY